MRELTIEMLPNDKSGLAVMKTRGSINSNTSQKLDEELNNLIRQKLYTIVIDFADTDFISSSGIRVLLSNAVNLRKKDGDLIFMNVTRIVDRIFDTLNLKSHFRFINSTDELVYDRS
jgi:anti-anti-sigma factor